MDSYHKVVVPQKRSQENEIFVNSKSPASHLLSRVVALFKEKNYTEVTFRATGGAISTAVSVAELTKRRVEGLHQITTIGTTDVSSVFEPTIEGLDKHEQTRLVSSIVILLSLNALDAKTPGYQAPLSAAEFKASQEFHRPQRTTPPGTRGPRTNNGPRGPRASSSNTASSAPGEPRTSPENASGEGRSPSGTRGPRTYTGPRRGGRGPRSLPRNNNANESTERSDSPSQNPRGPRRSYNNNNNNNNNNNYNGGNGPNGGNGRPRGPRTGGNGGNGGNRRSPAAAASPSAQETPQ